jgi:hypothetical protein
VTSSTRRTPSLSVILLTMVIALIGTGVVLPPTAAAAAADTLAAPTNLHQSGTDEYGYPILDWEPSADHVQYGYYHIFYDPAGPEGYPAMGSGGAPWHTEYDVWGYCIESGTYHVSVQFVRPDGATSARSNVIQIVLNTPF